MKVRYFNAVKSMVTKNFANLFVTIYSPIMKILLLVVIFGLASADVCSICKCQNEIANCKNLKLEDHFHQPDDWSNQIKTAWLDLNNLVHLTVFPNASLTRLSLSHNRISVIDNKAFSNLEKLTELDLSHNELVTKTLHRDIFQGKYSDELYLPMKNLKILNLGSNLLHSLQSDIFSHLQNLEVLILRSNPFTVLDHQTVIAISYLSFIKVLDLADTQLKELPTYSLHSPMHLEELDLSENLFQEVPEELGLTHELKKLVFSSNPIHTISTERPFPSLPNLEVLIMNYMHNLTRIEARGLSQLPSLKIFKCSDNKMLVSINEKSFSRKVEGIEGEIYPPIQELSIYNNALSSLESGLLARWDNANIIDIRGNPWLCDCTNQWMVNILLPLIERTNQSEYYHGIICQEPIEMKGRSMLQLDRLGYQMRCLDMYGSHPEKDGPMLIGILVGVVMTVPVLVVVLIAWRKGREAICGASRNTPRVAYRHPEEDVEYP